MATPGNDNPLNSQINAYNSINNQYLEMNALYASDLKSLVAWMKQDPTHRAGEALWRFQMWVMPDATQSCEYHMALEADALNIANTIRNDITNAQNDYNNVENNIIGKNTAAAKSAANQLSNDLKKLSQDLGAHGLTKIIGVTGLSTLKNYLSNIKENIHGDMKQSRVSHYVTTGYTHISWTSVVVVGRDDYYTVHKSRLSPYQKSGITHVKTSGPGGIYTYLNYVYSQATKAGSNSIPPAFSNITSGFNNLNQSVSGISSTIQAQMQYLNNNLQQFFGIFKSFFDDFSQLSSYITQKSGPS